jgi:hypothetical protein
MRLAATVVFLFFVFISSRPSWGQAPAGPIPGIEPGQKVTIHRDGGETVKGVVVRAESGSVVVDAGKKGGVMQVPNSDIVRIGRKNRAKGAMLGAAVGFGLGFAIGAGAGSNLADDNLTASEKMGYGVGFGGLFGGIFGGIGAATGFESTVYRRR